MFQAPWMTTMTIAATWMYRSLSDFGSSSVYMYGSLLSFFPASTFTVRGQCPCSSDELLPVQGQPMSEIRLLRLPHRLVQSVGKPRGRSIVP
ncbi:hypothetical protein BC826DRAFT_658200 [Russula brevipes]|nr:hypothetical protein BC826DRAFT_658200 [Russula brevipes]